MKISISAPVMALGLMLMSLAGQCYGTAEDLQVGFYADKCVRSGIFGLFPREYNVEDIVAAKVRYAYFQDKTIVAALLRLQFHDCFVHVSFSIYIFIHIFLISPNIMHAIVLK